MTPLEDRVVRAVDAALQELRQLKAQYGDRKAMLMFLTGLTSEEYDEIAGEE